MIKKIMLLLALVNIAYASELKLVQKIEIENLIVKIVVLNDRILAQTPGGVLMLSKDKNPETSITKPGEGPGEQRILVDFIAAKDKIIVADFNNKISIFDSEGKLKTDVKVKGFVENILFSNDKLYYLTKQIEKNADKKVSLRISLRDSSSEKEVTSYEDRSLVFADRPGQKISPIPWFPAPFYNRLTLISLNNNIWAFFTREDTFYEISENEIKKRNFKFKLVPEKILPEDIDRFFERLESVNKRKFPDATKKSVDFPKTKELFLGVIAMGDGFGLITRNELIRISTNGDIKERIRISHILNTDAFSDDTNSPIEKRIFYDNNRLYFASTDGEIYLYNIVKK